MCTIDDSDIDGEIIIPTTDRNSNDLPTCNKCTLSRGIILLRGKDAYCKSCFIPVVTHKFKSCLGKSKLMKPTDHVLVAFSGSQSSTALLHMLWTATQEDDHKKLLYKMSFLYIDEGAIMGHDLETRKKNICDIKKLIKSYNFPAYITSLSKSIRGENFIVNEESTFDCSADEELMEMFRNVGSLTAQEDLQLKLRQNLLFNSAREVGCNKIFTAEEQTALAVKLLTSIAMGRGEQLALEVGFQDSRHSDILLLRPMRDLDRKEIAYYNSFSGLTCQHHSSLTEAKPRNSSVRKLTEEFVTGLHKDYPSTVSTIFRIGEKLQNSKSDVPENETVCLLCRGSIKTTNVDLARPYSSVDATTFSKTMSCSEKKPTNNVSGCCGSCNCNSDLKQFSDDELKQIFCYGCLLILNDLKSLSFLPPKIIDEAKQRLSLLTMRNEIAAFLL